MCSSSRGGESSRRRRRPPGQRPRRRAITGTAATEKVDFAAICKKRASNEDAAPLLVPGLRQDCEAPSVALTYVSLDELFGSRLADAFEGIDFRDRLRMAGRQDLATSRALVSDRSTSVQGTWRVASYDALDDVLSPFSITGRQFVHTLGSLSLPDINASACADHFMDIVGIRDRWLPHSWHQDMHGRSSQLTVMLGFPAGDFDPNEGTTGVFSHVARLSHLMTVQTSTIGPLDFQSTDFAVDDLPEGVIIRPRFQRGQEILVYSDAAVIHSAPDLAHRESIWRIM